MLATYDVRRSPTRALAITFAVAASLILGGAGGFALKAVTQAASLGQAAPTVVTSLAAPMAGHDAAQMMRIELKDQQSQSQSASAPAIGAAAESNNTNSRFGPR